MNGIATITELNFSVIGTVEKEKPNCYSDNAETCHNLLCPFLLISAITMDVRTVVHFAAVTRGLSLFLQAAFNAVIPDHNAEAFMPPRTEEPLYLDSTVDWLLSGLSRWDAEHFLFIAERGYLYEHNFAFFPLFPILLRGLADTLLWPVSSWLGMRGRLLVAVALGNSALFLLSVVALHALSRTVLQDRRLAMLSTLLYCITPANVFMTAGYSESLFAALTFGGLYLLEKGFTFRACLALSIATAARSNWTGKHRVSALPSIIACNFPDSCISSDNERPQESPPICLGNKSSVINLHLGDNGYRPSILCFSVLWI
ncbi:hypothetical protein fugu_009877 [Takifugu bimaculatus]|uniref:GPI mannosyltransferase 2 n=1 Tax=Takifugu bimaculatus TaxID=433685 RepID=A0A4Z2CE30_9TELE|nr:hypothetical protein fugu_009877 [Takifugu bimaculatus]